MWLPRSGVTIGNPEFEYRIVARVNLYHYEDWCALDRKERERQVAQYRQERAIEAVQNKDAVDKAKAANK